MKTMTMSELQAHYVQTLDLVVDDREEVVVARPNGKNVVIVSEDEYSSLKETAYLLRNPKNAGRLLSSIESLKPHRHWAVRSWSSLRASRQQEARGCPAR